MSKREVRQLICALDIGTSKIACAIGQLHADNSIELVGLGSHPSRGLKRGVVVNIEATAQSIRRAVEAAELMADARVHEVFVGLSGTHIRGQNSSGVVPVRGREVSDKDVDNVVDAARAVAIPADQKVLHVVPQEFVLDGQDGIQHPVGMSGVRLEARVHIITGQAAAAQNIQKCVESCGLKVDRLCLPHLTSSHAVLLADERDLGVAVVDIGGGTTDIAVFKGGAIRHTAVLPVAGEQVTNDISIAFRTAAPFAENLKLQLASAWPAQGAYDDVSIEIPGAGEMPSRRISRHMLAEVVRPRLEELFRLIAGELERSGWYDAVAGGIVLTGGTALTSGISDLAEAVTQLPVRVGVPHGIRGMPDFSQSPAAASVAGLLIYGREMQGEAQAAGGPTGLWVQRFAQWLKGNL